MLQTFQLIDFGDRLDGLYPRRTAIVVAVSVDAAINLAPGRVAIPFPVEAADIPMIPTVHPSWTATP